MPKAIRLCLLLMLVPPLVAGSHDEIQLGGPGWIAFAVAPEGGVVDVEANLVMGSYGAFGWMYYHLDDPSNPFAVGGALWGRQDVGGVAYEIDHDAVGRHEGEPMRIDGWTETGMDAQWYGEPMGFILFAAGNITQFDARIVSGTAIGSASGPEAIAAWGHEFERGEGRVSWRAPVPHIGQEGYHAHETSAFNMPRPFIGDFDFGFRDIDNLVLEGPHGVYPDHTDLVPAETSAGEHTVIIDGFGYDGLIYWVVAPELPT